MNLTPQQKLQILRDIETNVALAYTRAIEILNTTLEKITKEKTKELEENFSDLSDKMVEKIKEISVRVPEDGTTPTADELKSLIVPLMPEKAKDGHTPTKDELKAIIKPLIPKVKDGKDGVDGKNGLNGKDGGPDKPIQIAEKLNTLDEKVDKKVIKGLNNWMESVMSSLRERKKGGGSGSGGGMGNWVHEVFNISSATTSVSVAQGIAANGSAILVRYQGQLLAHNVQYTINGKVITLIFTPQDDTFLEVTYVRT